MTPRAAMFFNTLLSITLAILGNFLVAGAVDGRMWWPFGVLALLSAVLAVIASDGTPGRWSLSWRAVLPTAYVGAAVALGIIARLGPAYQGERIALLDTFSITLAILVPGLAALVGLTSATLLRKRAHPRELMAMLLAVILLGGALSSSVMALCSTLVYSRPSADPSLAAPYEFCLVQLDDLQKQLDVAALRYEAEARGATSGLPGYGPIAETLRVGVQRAAEAVRQKQEECKALADQVQQMKIDEAGMASSPGSRLPLATIVIALVSGLCGLGVAAELLAPGANEAVSDIQPRANRRGSRRRIAHIRSKPPRRFRGKRAAH